MCLKKINTSHLYDYWKRRGGGTGRFFLGNLSFIQTMDNNLLVVFYERTEPVVFYLR